jgi:hypothetical protein
VRAELTFRRSSRAKQLLREVDGVIRGQVVPPRPRMKAPGPNDQGTLFNPKRRDRA